MITHAQRVAWLRDLATQTPTGECVDWPWPTDEDGYPRAVVLNGRLTRPTHLVLILSGVLCPPGSDRALHSCDRPLCVAPWHLRWGTNPDNMRDKKDRGRVARLLGESNGQAKLTREAVEQIRSAVASGASQRSQARAFGVSQPLVHRIIHHEIWR